MESADLCGYYGKFALKITNNRYSLDFGDGVTHFESGNWFFSMWNKHWTAPGRRTWLDTGNATKRKSEEAELADWGSADTCAVWRRLRTTGAIPPPVMSLLELANFLSGRRDIRNWDRFKNLDSFYFHHYQNRRLVCKVVVGTEVQHKKWIKIVT